MEKVSVVNDYVKHVRRFNLRGRTVEFKLNDIPANAEPVAWIKDAIGEIISYSTKDLLPSDQVAFNFGCMDFARGDGWVRFRPASEVTFGDIWGVISSIYQSNSQGLNTETFCLGVTSVNIPAGKGRGRKYNTFDEECSKRRGIITIKNSDNLCLPRALVVAKALVDKDNQYVQVRKDNGKLQTNRAKELVKAANVCIPSDGCGISELQKFQQHLSDYRIVVYRYGSRGRDVTFSGNKGTKNLNLIFENNHYNVITSLTAALCCSYFCEDCHIPYNAKGEHRCVKTCPSCQQSPVCQDEIKVKCIDCLRTFKSQVCYNNHKQVESKGKTSVCQKVRLCPNCLRATKSERNHICGEVYCKTCQAHKPQGHLCFMRPDQCTPRTEGILYLFYDLETRQEKQLEDGSFEHEVNLCVFKQCCEKCLNEPGLYFCQMCGFKTKVLKEDCVSKFMGYLLEIRKKFKDVVVLAHNGQAFDHQFLINHILTKTALTPELIMRGTKIVLMQVGNIKFLDSLNYFPMPLSALPKAFGLSINFKKGYFPHLFNTKKNEDYVGPLPAVKYYNPNNMKENERRQFLEWYSENKSKIFDFKKELTEYCVSDVDILTEACLKFRQQMITTTNVCPFSEACTIASACNKVFRRNFLKPNTIGIIPKGGYRKRDNQSKVALQWLIWSEHSRQIKIQHAAKGQEAILHGLKVDGFCQDTNQVFEFQGCYWHGCTICFKHQRDEPLPDNPSETLNTRYESTITKIERLRFFGYDVIEMKECDFRKNITPEMQLYIDNQPLLSSMPLNPRDAFYGGRTGNCVTYYKAKPGEKIRYLDVCSLYPWVCKYGKFPVAHPKVFVGDECHQLNLSETDGLIKCKILPPQNLYHPVLPVKMNNKLMFVLCHKCGSSMNDEICNHTDEERSLSGTWVIDEVRKAIEKGYKLLKIFEVWKYEVEQYDKVSKIGGLFVHMMNQFIKIKTEASGWPSECVTEEQKYNYIEKFFHQEGIKLEFADISKNPGLRCLSKLMLNSFWGKLGQLENQPKTTIVNDPEVLFTLLSNPFVNVNSALPVSEDTLIVNYEFKEESYQPLSTTNVCLAAYTTTQARLKLYSYLERLGDRVLYYDTDSVIFVQKDGEFEPSVGDFIGDMTDELQDYGVGSYITEFVSGGPKNYSYRFYTTNEKEEKVVCKVKGICLNYNASQLVNFESIKEMVLNPDIEPVKIISTNIRRTKTHEVVTRQETKVYKPNSLKRKFHEDHSSVPFGFKQSRTENISNREL